MVAHIHRSGVLPTHTFQVSFSHRRLQLQWGLLSTCIQIISSSSFSLQIRSTYLKYRPKVKVHPTLCLQDIVYVMKCHVFVWIFVTSLVTCGCILTLYSFYVECGPHCTLNHRGQAEWRKGDQLKDGDCQKQTSSAPGPANVTLQLLGGPSQGEGGPQDTTPGTLQLYNVGIKYSIALRSVLRHYYFLITIIY